MSNRTFVLIKPEGVQRKLIGEIISRFEKKGLFLERIEIIKPHRQLIEQHYLEHQEKDFYPRIVDHLTDKQCVAMIWANYDTGNAVFIGRNLIGSTDPVTANPGTIRGDFGTSIGLNVIHGSDSPQTAAREINLWFEKSNLKKK